MKNVTAAEAYALQQKGHTYVDIRSSAEFESGHPAGALNVPLIEQDEESGMMLPNPDFVRVMQANFAPDAKLLVGCQSGGRSARADAGGASVARSRASGVALVGGRSSGGSTMLRAVITARRSKAQDAVGPSAGAARR